MRLSNKSSWAVSLRIRKTFWYALPLPRLPLRGVKEVRSPGRTTEPDSPHYPLSTTHYPLPTTHYPLPTNHYPLPTTHCPLTTNH